MLKQLKNIAKNLLANRRVRVIHTAVNQAVLSVFSSSRLLATLYSMVVVLPFNREQFAVLRGRRNYYRNLAKDRTSRIELRRNIHRLEKGIIMQPPRAVFAKDYIEETIEFYENAVAQHVKGEIKIDAAELEWACSVLENYFSRVLPNLDSVVDKARQRFNATVEVFNPQLENKKVPYSRKDGAKSDVTYEQLLCLAQQRRSVRWFESKQVPRELIDKALLVARQAPTACNRLPYEFRVFDEPQLVKRVADIPFGAAGYSHQIPTIIVVVGKLDSYFSARDRHAIYVDASLAAMSFMFALETLGLSSSVINWPDFEPLEMKMQRELGLDVSERVVMLIAVGYADPEGGVPYSQKKSLDMIRSYNVCGR